MDKHIFEPISQGVIPFEGKEIIKAQLADNLGYVSVRSLAEMFGITYKAFANRLSRSDYFGPYTAMIRLKTKGGPQPQLCLMAAAMPLFLSGTDIDRVQNEEGRALLKIFLDHVMDILAEHFGISESNELPILRHQIALMTREHEIRTEAGSTQEVEAKLKKMEAEMAERERAHQETIEKMRKAFADLRETIKDYNRAAGEDCISEEQQGEVYLAVETLGLMLEERGVAKPYPGIYMDLARISGRASYKQIPRSKYKAVLDFLHRQIEALGNPASKE